MNLRRKSSSGGNYLLCRIAVALLISLLVDSDVRGQKSGLAAENLDSSSQKTGKANATLTRNEKDKSKNVDDGKELRKSRDSELLDDIPLGRDVGEDIGPQNLGGDPLSNVVAKMKVVQDRMKRQDLSQRTQETQRQIVQELSELIRQAECQCKKPGKSTSQTSKSSSSSKAESTDSENKASSSAKPGKKSGHVRNGESAEREQSDAEGRGQANRDAAMAMKAIWGQLPETIRQQLGNVAPEQFLPKYQQMIEEYYKRLSESE